MGSRGGGYTDRLSHREMLSYGFKYGEPWGEDRRALERAFREADTGSERTSESAWTSGSSSGLTFGGSESTDGSTQSTSSSGGLSRVSMSSWGTERAHKNTGVEVVRVGGGNEVARYHTGAPSRRASDMATPSYPGGEDNAIRARDGAYWNAQQQAVALRAGWGTAPYSVGSGGSSSTYDSSDGSDTVSSGDSDCSDESYEYTSSEGDISSSDDYYYYEDYYSE
ncbi:hypothetical protein D9615_000651 [Tricholomella constricta]|uniref:Uncharacterized protein n=1 Tax=Tricholomella constricta TaxID=117010 RepID=A0A8H5HS06_9AGAR|nr:hypothetical protein D9615_000651 [Tricholomella constricta]